MLSTKIKIAGGIAGAGLLFFLAGVATRMPAGIPTKPAPASAPHYSVKTPFDENAPAEVELANVRRLILSIDPTIPALPPFERSLALRGLLHKKIAVKFPSPVDIDWTNSDRATFLALTDDRYGMVCGGFTIIFLTVLRAFDVPARYVGIFEQVDNVVGDAESHATVEVYADKRWIALDAMFDFSLRDETGEYLNWEQARTHRDSGQKIAMEIGGVTTPPSEFKGFDLLSHLNYMIMAPARVGGVVLPHHIAPAKWDGVIRYTDKRRFDMVMSVKSDPYARLLARTTAAD